MLNPLSWIPALLGVIGRILGPLAGFMWGRSREKAKQAQDSLDRAEKGRKGAVEAKSDLAKGKTPDQIVRDNDEKWN